MKAVIIKNLQVEMKWRKPRRKNNLKLSVRFSLLSQVLILKHVIALVKEEICQKKKNKKKNRQFFDLSTGNMPKSTNWQEVTYFQKRHWDSRFLLLICILQQYCYKCKLTFYKYLKYKLYSCQHAWETSQFGQQNNI